MDLVGFLLICSRMRGSSGLSTHRISPSIALQAEPLATEQHPLKPITVAGNKQLLYPGQELLLLSFVMSAPSWSYTSAKPSIKPCLVQLPTEQLLCREPTNQRVLHPARRGQPRLSHVPPHAQLHTYTTTTSERVP